MNRIGRREVERIAALARLRLDAGELEVYTEQLADVLGYVEKLGQLDTSGVEPTAHVLEISNVARPDVPGECLTVAEALANAPDFDADGGFYRVPRIIE